MPADPTDRQATSTTPEDDFLTLFGQTFGLEKTLLLAHEFPVQDIYGGSRSVDYALRTTDEKVAFEIDGLQWYLPDAISISKYEDDLLRQNSLIHEGWRVFRWTEQTVAHAHVHLIPRFVGDVAVPEGGIRNVIPGRGRYQD